MTDKAIETQLVDLERQYWEAIRNKDVDAAMRLEGKPVTVEAADTSTWTRRNGRWLCSVHTEALAGDRYGRDRLATS